MKTFVTLSALAGLLFLSAPAFAGDILEDFTHIVKLKESRQNQALAPACEAFLKEHPDCAADELVLFYLGQNYYNGKKNQDAIKVFSDFLTRFPNSDLGTQASMLRGEAYRLTDQQPLMLPDFQRAFEAYQKANDIEAAHAQYHMVQAYQALKETDKAKAEAALLRKNYPDTSYAKTVNQVTGEAAPAAAAAKPTGLPVGSDAPNVDFVQLSDGAGKKLADFKGKVVVLDFWASWCGPCQAPMAKMQTYRELHPDWGDKVELIALSIDSTKDDATNHLKSKGWDKTYNAWAGEGGFKAPAPTAYQIRGIPTVYVIDQTGKIAATGHPASLQVSEIVNGLLVKK